MTSRLYDLPILIIRTVGAVLPNGFGSKDVSGSWLGDTSTTKYFTNLKANLVNVRNCSATIAGRTAEKVGGTVKGDFILVLDNGQLLKLKVVV